ncbi:MAG: hypothetical protein HUJ60_01630 [Bacilli bacterium]|nr:hypothetical protein [Bacilli bacterium]
MPINKPHSSEETYSQRNSVDRRAKVFSSEAMLSIFNKLLVAMGIICSVLGLIIELIFRTTRADGLKDANYSMVQLARSAAGFGISVPLMVAGGLLIIAAAVLKFLRDYES